MKDKEEKTLSPVEEFREVLIDQLHKELIGPNPLPGDLEEILDESPRQRYSAGILFPSNILNNEAEDYDEDSGEIREMEGHEIDLAKKEARPSQAAVGETLDEYDDTITMASTYMPSAMGISFLCDNSPGGLKVVASAAIYKTAKRKVEEREFNVWVRNPLDLPVLTISLEVDSRGIGIFEQELRENLNIKAVIRRRNDDSRLVTVSMYNTQINSGSGIVSATDCFFQSSFKVFSHDGSTIFRAYQEMTTESEDPEETSLRLLYRNRLSFGVGHGCAVKWSKVQDGKVDCVETDSFPFQKIPPVEPRSGQGEELNMVSLAGGLNGEEQEIVPDILQALVNDYSSWIEGILAEAASFQSPLKEAADRHINLCQKARNRIQDGIVVLKSNPVALSAFCMANKAMLMQQYHNKRSSRSINEEWVDISKDYNPVESWMGRWRTFQLAFILMNLGTVTPNSEGKFPPERDLVDLIWFPTGGGKTEAYLGLAAYTIFLRRLLQPNNAGCAVLMRYTLRLLTAQQFQRAAALICACEFLRRNSPELLGEEIISIGLWVGQSLTPNTRREAIGVLSELVKNPYDGENKFQLLKCPWCGTKLDEKGKLGYRVTGKTPKRILFVCPESRCEFSSSKNPLPVLVTDEDIYENPPALLIGTVDKFAMLAWRGQASSLFGKGRNVLPPELIIQDELHLISGPLGTLVGLYEGVIELLCTRKDGTKPKIVGSTATIRRAGDQCKALYNRETFQFPPPGINSSDSYFAKENNSTPGRIYMGVFPTASPSFVTALVRTVSSILQGVKTIDLPAGADESVRDPYWTLVEYFNSLRELGRALTLLQADIPEYMWVVANRLKLPKEKTRNLYSIEELTSRKSAQEIPEILETLSFSWPFERESKKRPLDALLATNMFSVGVDIDRLGLMSIVGQPKSTSEYIQSSSRVGRSKDAPGLVIVMYNPGKPRDRSHFEQFRTYHSALYRYVEPTSVTPYSIPVMERALHSLLVIVGRHIAGWKNPEDADFNSPEINTALSAIANRCKAIDPDHLELLEERLENLKEQWLTAGFDTWGTLGNPHKDKLPLMYPAGSSELNEWNGNSWATPSSMRFVDTECEAEVIHIYPV